MRNIWLVIKHDVAVTLRQRSFWILSLVMPLILVAIQVFAVSQRSDLSTASSNEGGIATGNAEDTNESVIGLVDEAGLMAETPDGFPADPFLTFQDQGTARAALEAGEVGQYIFVPADYVSSGEIIVYDRDFQIRSGDQGMGAAFTGSNARMLEYLINYNLTGDEQLVLALQNPVPGQLAEHHIINPQLEGEEPDEALVDLLSSLMPYVYYFLLLLGSSYLMRSVVAEKENHTAEVLLLSLDPRQMMVGKILAISVIVALQVTIWVGSGLLIFNQNLGLLNLPELEFQPGFLIWAVLFLVLGYLLFASVMAAAGAMANTAREGGQMTFLLMIPLMPTLMFGSLLAEEPNHPLTLVLSLFPFSAPSAMVTRLAITEVPVWQILVSLTLLALTAYLFISLAARYFRAGNLLSQTPFSLRRVATGWRR